MSKRYSAITLGPCLFIALTAITASAQVNFSTHTYPNSNLWVSNSGQNSTVRADLNSDGREDFISPTAGSFSPGCSGQFAVSLSTGDGTYAAPVCYSLPSTPNNAWKFAVGDFYGIGTLDVAVSDTVGNLYIYKNSGAGTLSLVSSLAFPNEIQGLVSADINHDGRIDLVYFDVNTSGAYAIHTLFGNGDGTFATGPVSPVPSGNNSDNALLIGDFDGNGRADLLIFNQAFCGDDKGGFTPGPSGNAGEEYQPLDVNSDGTMELIGSPETFNTSTATFTYHNYLDLIFGHYNRTFTTQNVPLKSCTYFPFPAQSADFDGDGIADLIVTESADCAGNGPYTLNFMKGNGNGTFQPEQVIFCLSG
jgi:hypothetical protein